MNHFKGKQFKKDVIIVAVGYYLRYNLSYREVQELLYDRGINVCHTTIYRWVQEYSKVLYYLWKKKNRQSFYSWKMDETYIKIKGRWHYLYRAIDADGLTLDIWLRKKRDTQVAYAFLKRLHKQFGEPKAIVTDKAPSLGSAFRKLQSVGLYTKTEHRTVKYLNNLIEQDHRPIKRRNKFYQSLRTASSTVKGMETIRGIYKKNRRNGTLFGFSVSTEIKVLMGNNSLRYLEFREGAFDFQTSQQNLRNYSNFKKRDFMPPTSKKKGQTYPSSLLKFSSRTTVNKHTKISSEEVSDWREYSLLYLIMKIIQFFLSSMT
ncbi:Integrase core domain protein [Streptococcus parasanguinis]|uniref:Integrase core domain protein n=13 Tax=Bacilli TaxID=91061 RepID=A0A6N3B3B7_STRPA